MEADKIAVLSIFTSDDLAVLTDHFSENNFIGKTQFCKVYRGKIPQGWKGMAEQCVTVKMWADKVHMFTDVNLPMVVAKNRVRFEEEIMFLTGDLALNCPYLGKLKGFCHEQMGVVYDLNSIDTLHNLITGGTLKWVDRIRILYQFAVLLEHLHAQKPEYLVRNISAAHIMINQDLKPVLFEFGMLCKGQFQDIGLSCFVGAAGYMDTSIAYTGFWSRKIDVYAFGVLILELLCKLTVGLVRPPKMDNYVDRCAEEIYTYEKSESYVSKMFDADPTFDAEGTLALLELATKCLIYSDVWSRPSMSEIVKLLESFSNI